MCLKLLFKNKNFIKLFVFATLAIGYLNLYGTVTNTYFSKYGVTENEIFNIGSLGTLLGMLLSILNSIIIDKYKTYKKSHLFFNGVCLISHICFTILLEVYESQSYVILMVFYTLCQGCIIPLYTAGMDLVIELTYPVGETISGGIIQSSNQIFGVVLV